MASIGFFDLLQTPPDNLKKGRFLVVSTLQMYMWFWQKYKIKSDKIIS